MADCAHDLVIEMKYLFRDGLSLRPAFFDQFHDVVGEEERISSLAFMKFFCEFLCGISLTEFFILHVGALDRIGFSSIFVDSP